MPKETIKILALGDVVSKFGRQILVRELEQIRTENDVDLVIANAENAATGNGLTPNIAKELFEAGVDFITLGDHVWRHRELRAYLDSQPHKCIRPANFPEGVPGQGWSKIELGDLSIGVVNVIGRVFFNTALDCPFQAVDRIIKEQLNDCQIICCDFHAEATSEKNAMGIYLRERASFVWGTHTHVQTSDSRIIEKTAYITDLGMCGPSQGVIGMDFEPAITRLRMGLPSSYKPAKGKVIINGAIAEIKTDSGQAVGIERVYREYDL